MRTIVVYVRTDADGSRERSTKQLLKPVQRFAINV
jgi:hypothetical protein